MTSEEVATRSVQYSKEPSTDIVYKQKKRLAKLGKDTLYKYTIISLHENSVYPKW